MRRGCNPCGKTRRRNFSRAQISKARDCITPKTLQNRYLCSGSQPTDTRPATEYPTESLCQTRDQLPLSHRATGNRRCLSRAAGAAPSFAAAATYIGPGAHKRKALYNGYLSRLAPGWMRLAMVIVVEKEDRQVAPRQKKYTRSISCCPCRPVCATIFTANPAERWPRG